MGGIPGALIVESTVELKGSVEIGILQLAGPDTLLTTDQFRYFSDFSSFLLLLAD